MKRATAVGLVAEQTPTNSIVTTAEGLLAETGLSEYVKTTAIAGQAEVEVPEFIKVGAIGLLAELDYTITSVTAIGLSTEYSLKEEKYLTSIGLLAEVNPLTELDNRPLPLTKKILATVADAYFYDLEDNLLFVCKTVLSNSLVSAISNSEVRAGKGNSVQYQYFHSSAITLELEDTQWNLDFIANSVNQAITVGTSIYKEERIILDSNKSGSVSDTPLYTKKANSIYGWITHTSGIVERVIFSGNNFTCSLGNIGDSVCVRYYTLSYSARETIIPASIIPKTGRMVLEMNLYSSAAITKPYGKVQVLIPKISLAGQFVLGMSSDGSTSTPVTGKALPYGTYNGKATYASITEIIDGANWYDRSKLAGIAIAGGDCNIASNSKRQLVCYAVPFTGKAFAIPNSELTWDTNAPNKARVSMDGLVTWIASGKAKIHVTINKAQWFDTSITVTLL